MASSSLGSQSCKCGYSTLVSQLFCSRAALKRVRELRSSIADGPAIPSAAKDLENGLTAAANPWGCPPPGGGCASLRAPRAVPQGVEDAGRRGGRVDDARNLGRRFCVHPSECSNAVVRGRHGAEPERTLIATAATTSVRSLSTATREVVRRDGHQSSLRRRARAASCRAPRAAARGFTWS